MEYIRHFILHVYIMLKWGCLSILSLLSYECEDFVRLWPDFVGS
jgi:hypothetical protein